MSNQEGQIADLVGKFKAGRISRRDFVHGVSLFGAAKPAAAVAAPTPGQPKKGGTFTAATIDKPVNMDPAFGELYSSIQVYDNIFAKLVYVTADNQYVPGLVKAWK
jgi:ABC-type transport system substrate-binding protein